MVLAVMVHEAGFGDVVYVISEDGRVRGNKSFEVARGGCRSTASRIEVLWDDLIAKSFVIIELTAHLLKGELASFERFFRALDDELEPLIKFVLDLLAVFEVFLGVLLQVLQLLGSVCEVGSVCACPCLREASGDPDR